MPAEYGSVTPSAAAVATAASTALPPRRNTSIPAAEASSSTLETAPPWPTATGDLPGAAHSGALSPGGEAAPTESIATARAQSESLRVGDGRIPYLQSAAVRAA